MKKFVLLTLVILPLLQIQSAKALSGGPDLFGYTWNDSNEPGGPTYSWIDIVTSDRKVEGLGDDNIRGPFQMDLNNLFRFYWYPVDKFWIGSNGYIGFSSASLASLFPMIPDSTDNRHNFISAMLADLTFSGAGNPAECYYRDTYDSLVVSWINVPFYYQFSPYWSGGNTFQIILNKNDWSITINFQSQFGSAMNNDIKTGIENITGTIGLMPFYATYPAAGYSIKYYYPQNPTYFVKDGATLWNTQNGSGGRFLPFPSTYNLKARVANVGNLDIAPLFKATGKVRNQSWTNLVVNTVYFTDTLIVFQDSVLNYLTPFTVPSTGTYSFVTRLDSVNGDNIHSNDSVVQELVAIDTSLNFMSLNFTDNVPDFPGISWVDGTGGIGVYVIPPSYPVLVYNMMYWIESNPNGAIFIGKLYDDDGPGGEPGTLLDSVMFPGTVFTGGWNTITPSQPVVIYSGGVYVAWEMFGTGITLARDITPPISYRTFEFVGSIWSPYRMNEDEDFLIQLNVEQHLLEDVGTAGIISPVEWDSLNAPAVVSCWVKNYGQYTESTFDVKYQMWGQGIVSESYTGPALVPGDSALFTFSALLSSPIPTNGNLCVWTSKMNDADYNNDSTCHWIYLDTTQIGPGFAEMQSANKLRIYPNPFTDRTYIEFDNDAGEAFRIILTDICGKLVFMQEGIKTDHFTLERFGLKPGIYLLHLQGPNDYYGKLIVR